MSVTVITSTIGRPELRKCIESVRAQMYPGVKHHVYVNGPRWEARAYHEIREDWLNSQTTSNLSVLYLSEETGAYDEKGPSCGGVFAGAPFLAASDWIFYLNDDDFYDPNHVASVMALAKEHDLSWAYSLRRFVRKDGEPIVDDDWCSLGHYPIRGSDGTQFVVDNSCFAVKRTLAERYGRAWTTIPTLGDRLFLMALKESKTRSGCTGLVSVNYRTGTGSAPDEPEKYLEIAEMNRRERVDGFPWRTARVFG